MALASTFTATVEGVSAHLVTVESNVGPGLPGIFVVGLGDATVRESRDRIRTATTNTGLPWPRTKIMVSLSPADVPKTGSHFDLPIALAVLSCTHPAVAHRMRTTLVAGELGLDGQLRAVGGVLPMLIAARHEGIRHVVIPRANAAEAALLGERNILVADTLAQVWEWAQDMRELDRAVDVGKSDSAPREDLDFADIAGQDDTKRIVEIAAAGAHHLFMVGPPGSGKSMLAQRIPSILPPLSSEQMVEATAVHSVVSNSATKVITHAPLISPHPGVTRAALIGGGPGSARPGAISMAHHGVLFLDEVSEVSASVIDSLRIPLEEGQVRLARPRREVVFPAQFQLVMAANPCRCGTDDPLACTCSSRQRATYLNNISGPLRDRIDISVEVTNANAVLSTAHSEPSSVIAARVAAARDRAEHRWSRAGVQATTNAAISPSVLRRDYPADEAGMALLGAYLACGDISQRGVDRAIKLAWTLCDLAGATQPTLDHVAQAIDLRDTTGVRSAA
ncbi:YifB family Mg chelatase-like AAA ATPase [Corynebacterium breve]|uniref:YifB family Mg chelatase-like AAA ATPase n=1 Tax=Corynebacterium breve TaxID=3049799 RepID=A0ABY8VC33_9CORY|nr:YifB family Mg chelatase-like AAA ATPase [Corynebacterium breve]WIM66882.1 YifB family Mg chelatase-like AAA ATPase [Corynebacterium breve]